MLYGTGKYTYELVENWAQLPEGMTFSDVPSIFIDNKDKVYIFSRSENPITVFDRNGKLLARWGKGYFKWEHGSCIGPDGSIYLTDGGNHTVTKFTNDGKVLMMLGTKGKPSDTGYREVPSDGKHPNSLWESIASIRRGGPPFNKPTGVALSSTGEIYVTDGYGNARVHKFSKDGKLLFSWGEPGAGPGQFRYPHSVHVDKQERVWVCDRENSRIQIFNDDGKFLEDRIDLIRPQDLFIDDDKKIVYVGEGAMRVSIFTTAGQLLARWGNENHDVNDPLFFSSPHAIAVDSKGDLYTGSNVMTNAKNDIGSKAVRKFVRK
jgi:hypothetical protein